MQKRMDGKNSGWREGQMIDDEWRRKKERKKQIKKERWIEKRMDGKKEGQLMNEKGRKNTMEEEKER